MTFDARPERTSHRPGDGVVLLLDSLVAQRVSVVATHLGDEVRRLKAQPGGPINIQGSASIVQALARADLIDEYRLYVHPVLLGDGKRLFANGLDRQDLALAGIKPYANGVVATTYRRRT